MATAENEYDFIFIGSGMGSLAAASILAQFRNKRVLILERHYVLGGFTHEFDRRHKGKKYSWDVGIHYVGDMQDDGMMRRLSDIITREGVKWNPMPDVFEKFVYPDFTFSVPSNEERYRASLIEMFPDEEQAIVNYFEDIKKVDGWFGRHNMKSPHPFVDKVTRKLDLAGADSADITVGEYLDRNFKDPKLKALIISQWGDYGIPPAKSSFVIQSTVAKHYFKGGFYPVGGSRSIAESVQPIVEEFGGEIKLSHEAREIIIEDGKAVGVRARKLTARKGEPDTFEFRAPVIVSNTGAYTTYLNLIPQSVEIPFRDQLRDFYKEHKATTAVTLYVGLNGDPKDLGFAGENHWMYASYDHDANFEAGGKWIDGESPVMGAYLSFPSLKNPHAQNHTAEIIAFTQYEPFAKWADSSWKRRGDEYEELKKSISDKLINFVEERYPGFKAIIEFHELSTPLTVTSFTAHPKGSVYGMACVRERFRSDLAPWCSSRTPVEGLYLTGADASSPGIAGALMGGMSTLAQVPGGISFIKLLKEAGKPAEKPALATT